MKKENSYWISLVLFCGLGLAGGTAVADVDKLVKACADCHEKDGNSKNGETPSIAGMSSGFFLESIKSYKSNTRPALKLKDKKEDMKDVVKKLSDTDIKALADYFGKQKFKPFKQEFDPALAKLGKQVHKQYCDKCHAEGGTSSEDDAGILAGQPMGYLRYSMDNYANGKREMGEKMSVKFKAMQEKVGNDGIMQVIHYYASQQ